MKPADLVGGRRGRQRTRERTRQHAVVISRAAVSFMVSAAVRAAAFAPAHPVARWFPAATPGRFGIGANCAASRPPHRRASWRSRAAATRAATSAGAFGRRRQDQVRRRVTGRKPRCAGRCGPSAGRRIRNLKLVKRQMYGPREDRPASSQN